jgi:molecular chaperone DnaJ
MMDVAVERVERCGHCHGTGSEDGKPTTCPHCGGKGMIQEFNQTGGGFTMFSHPCGFCHGTGHIITNPCHECHGSGEKVQFVKERVDIPRGLSDGMTIVLQGKGNPVNGGINGDMLINIHVSEDPYFVRPDAVNLIHHEPVPFNEALLGFKKKFRCIDGSEVTVNAPELTPHGKAFIFKGKGMPDHNGGGYGDYAVVIDHVLPKKLTSKQKDILKHFND